jgi:E3 ubiquitin-protein ligase MYCBP2
MAECRVRCPNCQNNFCSQCNKEPYHLGYTCEEAERYANAATCRFCLEELKKPSSSQNPAFRACCDSEECSKIRDLCCDKKLPCGHWCRGFKNEKKCLPCLNKDCIKKYNEGVPQKDKLLED